MKQLTKEDLLKLPHKFQIMFAVFCAKQVFYLINEKDKNVCFAAIEAAEGFIEGTVSREQAYTTSTASAAYTNAAANAAAYTATSTASATAYAAANATYAASAAAFVAANATYAASAAAFVAVNAANAASATDKEQTIKEQWEYYDELLNFEKNFEQILLGVDDVSAVNNSKK